MGRIPLQVYAAAVQEAIASSDLDKMRLLEKEAEAQVREDPKLRTALDSLKREIAKLESRRYRPRQD